ncbi:hypothetical protein, partial [Phaeobacter gallaeciensis]|uniref:hypothetical protein n=1 Tax=Phaeobacter gallaeciensis TaxID=60890 RepID=UPI00237F99DF
MDQPDHARFEITKGAVAKLGGYFACPITMRIAARDDDLFSKIAVMPCLTARDCVPGTGVTLFFGLSSAAITGRRFP